EDIEVLEQVPDPECPLCGKKVKIPPKLQGNKLRCPQCCAMFNIDGSEDDGSEEADAPPVKKTSGSKAGTEKVKAEAPADAPPSPRSTLRPWPTRPQVTPPPIRTYPKRDPDPLPKRDPDPEPKKDPDPPAPKEGEWVDVSLHPAHLGNVRVRVTGAFLNDVKIM